MRRLNKWAAASTEYSRDLMHRAADYAREAAAVFASIQPQVRGWYILCVGEGLVLTLFV